MQVRGHTGHCGGTSPGFKITFTITFLELIILEKACLICGKELENLRRKVCPGECKRLRKNQAGAKWRERNRDRHLAQKRERDRRYYQRNAEKRRVRERERYWQDPERCKKRQRSYRLQDPDRVRAQDKERYLKDPERKKAQVRTYFKTEKGRATSARAYNKRKRLLEGAVQEPYLRSEIAERDNWTCYLCGGHIEPDDLHIDHIQPLSLGGHDTPWNVAATHAACNLSKRNSFPEAARAKFAELQPLEMEQANA